MIYYRRQIEKYPIRHFSSENDRLDLMNGGE